MGPSTAIEKKIVEALDVKKTKPNLDVGKAM
jgi:hypothetical protein